MQLPRLLCLSLMVAFLFPPVMPAQAVLRIELGDYRFRPNEIRVSPGETVELELVNTDAITPHDFVLEIPEAGIDLRVDVPPGETAKAVFTAPSTPGTWPFYCSKRFLFFKSHRARGMEGRLIVLPGPKQPAQ